MTSTPMKTHTTLQPRLKRMRPTKVPWTVFYSTVNQNYVQ